MFERILVPLDGSERAEIILDQVRRFLKRDDAEIILLRAVDPHVTAYAGVDPRQLLAGEREEAARYLADLAAKLSAEGVAKVHPKVVDGHPAEAILDAARREGATLLTLATHGRRGLARWTLGSIAERVVRHSEIPVFLARSFRPGAHAPFWEPAPAADQPVRKVLVPTDGSEAAGAAIGPAEKIAQLFGAEVVVLHVVLPGVEAGWVPRTVPPVPTSDADEATRAAAERFNHAGLKVTRQTVVGDPTTEIIDHPFDKAIDLIVMATHGRTGLARWGLGSVAERVLRHTCVPLLLVRADASSPAARPLQEASTILL